MEERGESEINTTGIGKTYTSAELMVRKEKKKQRRQGKPHAGRSSCRICIRRERNAKESPNPPCDKQQCQKKLVRGTMEITIEGI